MTPHPGATDPPGTCPGNPGDRTIGQDDRRSRDEGGGGDGRVLSCAHEPGTLGYLDHIDAGLLLPLHPLMFLASGDIHRRDQSLERVGIGP
jgi:hypothetical protein